MIDGYSTPLWPNVSLHSTHTVSVTSTDLRRHLRPRLTHAAEADLAALADRLVRLSYSTRWMSVPCPCCRGAGALLIKRCLSGAPHLCCDFRHRSDLERSAPNNSQVLCLASPPWKAQHPRPPLSQKHQSPERNLVASIAQAYWNRYTHLHRMSPSSNDLAQASIHFTRAHLKATVGS